jgi:hypothetical protein
MESERLRLHEQLTDLYPTIPAYFRPPTNDILQYPCITYDFNRLSPRYSNNGVYLADSVFQVTVMLPHGSEFDPRGILSIPASRLTRSYMSSDIQHYIYEIAVKS